MPASPRTTLAVLVGLTFSLSACPSRQLASRSMTPPLPQASAAQSAPEAKGANPAYSPDFDEEAAWRHLTAQVAFGPRVPGTQGHKSCRRYIEQILTANCDRAEKQEFTVRVKGKDIPMVNIIGRFGLDQPRRVMLAAHWDTRPTADQNPPGQRNQPIDGANDGASGVAILLELARIFKQHPPPNGVDLVFFDGEDYGPGLDMMFLGAKHMASKLSEGQIRSYNYGILIDMVGDANLDIHPELNSEGSAGAVYQVAVEVSKALGYRCFRTSGAYEIYDDHLPLIARGIRMYDFIDFNYKPWHTTEDTVDKCSAESLGAVGKTLEVMIYEYPDLYAKVQAPATGSKN